jgi:methionyl-tRNA formyltransferase
MQHKKIVFLASDCESSRWVYNALQHDLSFEAAIIEQPVSKRSLIKGRLKKIGFLKVAGQVLFSALVVPILKIRAKKRKAELEKFYQLNGTAFKNTEILRVASVNDEACKQMLEQLQPDIVLVNGTRIISKKILQCTPAVFINMHVGITPMYRGSHGGYWALHNKDEANFGTTIHLVDTGVDTGAVLKQVFIRPAKQDNFTTYPVLQTAIGIEALKEVLPAMLKNEMPVIPNTGKGKMYYQPTLWAYLKSSTR